MERVSGPDAGSVVGIDVLVPGKGGFISRNSYMFHYSLVLQSSASLFLQRPLVHIQFTFKGLLGFNVL